MLIIETTISYDENKRIEDHQSRIVEVDSWEGYVLEIENNKNKDYHKATISGCTFPKFSKIYNVTHDENHLSCDVIGAVHTYKKLATRVHESFELKQNIK